MRALVIGLVAKLVEAPLLGGDAAGGRARRGRRIRSCRPFWSGRPGSMNSGRTPSHTHQAESFESRAKVVVANGTPLSVRIRIGKPYSLNSRVKMGFASATAVELSAWQPKR